MTAPPRDGVRSSLVQVENEDGIGLKPPLGLLHVASHVAARTTHRVHVLDASIERLGYAELADRVAALAPDVVGITAWTDFWYPAARALEEVKRRLPKVFTVVGGPHVLVFPEETLANENVDAIVAGDGETPALRLLECLARGVPEDGIPGLHFKVFGVHAQRLHVETRLDQLTHIDRTMLPLEPYSSVLGKGGLSTTLISSRGCPFGCVFCKISRQKPMQHSAEYILEEFDRIRALGIGEVEVYDDTFTWSPERVREICRGLIERGSGIRWAIRDRVNGANAETLALLRKAGCTRIHYGIESGCDGVLRRVKKRITVQEAERAVALAKQAGFEVLAFFMLGLPGESRQEFQRTIELALRLPADYCQFSITVAYPGTEMYTEALKLGRIPRDYWRDFARNPVPNFQAPFFSLNDFSEKELLRLRDEAIRRFYFRPRTMLNELAKLRSWGEFRRKAGMGFTLLRNIMRGPWISR